MIYRVLLSENERAVHDALRAELPELSYEIREMPMDATAFSRVEEYRPQLILSGLGVAGGILPFVQKVQSLPDPPLMMLIAEPGQREAASEGLSAGALDYIMKPLLPHEVVVKVSRALERKNAIEEAQLQLIQSETMASLGRLVAGVAHEINTPIGAIHSNSDVMARVLKKVDESIRLLPPGKGKEELVSHFETLSGIAEVDQIACERIADVVRNLKTFARLDESERKVVDIHDGLNSTVRLLQCDWRDRIRIEKDYGELPQIECYPNQLNQVFMNLLVNAAEAIEGHGIIRIRTRPENHEAVIQISDTGKGIPPGDLAKVFDPGFTTKGVGIGMGLGLSLVFKIIEAHAGTITAESTVGKGTTFTIALPVA